MVKHNFQSTLHFSNQKITHILNTKIAQTKDFIRHNATPQDKIYEQKLYSKVPHYPHVITIDSLFSGCGGLDLGVQLAGVSTKYGAKTAYQAIKNLRLFQHYQNVSNIIYSNDNFKEANQTYLHNFKQFNKPFIKDTRDIRKVIKFPKCQLMLGGFPCPGFSIAGPRLLDDPRNFLYLNYVRALVDAKPLFFIGENVKGLMTMAKGKVLHQIAQDFSSAGYKIFVNLVNAKNYGVPESRERVFLIGVRNDIAKKYHFQYKVPKTVHKITLYDAISDLPKKQKNVYQSSYSSIYMSRNRRRKWNQQSFTIQASGRQAPQYPGSKPMKKIARDKWIFTGWHRRLSTTEEARIQTFPKWFKFTRGLNHKASFNSQIGKVYKQIGNAVPVYLAEQMARPIMKFLLEHN